MIRGVYLNGAIDDWTPCMDIRKNVFKEVYDCSVSEDDRDILAIQVLLYDENNQPAASARLMFDLDGVYQFDYLAVLEDARGQGYGDFVMHMILDKANQCGANYLASYDIEHSPEYFKRYGFEMREDHMILDLKEYFASRKCCH